MLRWLNLSVICLGVLFAVWPRQALADGASVKCQITASSLRVRAAPDGAQIGTALGGTWLVAAGRDADATWLKIDWSGQTGWVMSRWLKCEGELDNLPETSAPEASEATPAQTSSDSAPSGLAGMAKAMADAVNDVRARAGLPPLVFDPRAITAAQWQAEDMVARRYFAHNTPDGRRPADLMRDQGLPCPGWCGQNIIQAWRGDDISESINWFMNSAPHRANLLHRRYIGIGVGVAELRPGVRYYVLNFYGE